MCNCYNQINATWAEQKSKRGQAAWLETLREHAKTCCECKEEMAALVRRAKAGTEKEDWEDEE